MIAIASAQRTPHGRFLGRLSDFSPTGLAVIAGGSAVEGVEHVDQVILGQMMAAGHGVNPARQLAHRLGFREAPAFTLDAGCGGGIQAITLAAMMILAKRAGIVLCGGVESMSQAPFLLKNLRTGHRLGGCQVVDGLYCDGLQDAESGMRMGELMEANPELMTISREAQDQFALASQQKAASAFEAGDDAAEIVPVDGYRDDEPRRPDSTLEGLAALRPAFTELGTVTAGNAAKMADGAAMLVLCDSVEAVRREMRVLAIIENWVVIAGEADAAPLLPIQAVKRLCEIVGRSLAQYDWIELMEAFAVQAIGCLDGLGLDHDDPRVNPDGGALAIGHPLAASPARIVGHLAHVIGSGRARNGLAAVAVGGGMGMAISLRAP